MALRPIDPLAHRALEALVRAEATLTRRLAADLDRIGVSATGFAMLVLLTSAGGRLELRAIRRRIGASKATATEVLDTLENRGFVERTRLESDRRAVSVRAHPGRRQPRHPRLPRPRRARPRGLRGARRGREAPARRHLPQAGPRRVASAAWSSGSASSPSASPTSRALGRSTRRSAGPPRAEPDDDVVFFQAGGIVVCALGPRQARRRQRGQATPAAGAGSPSPTTSARRRRSTR